MCGIYTYIYQKYQANVVKSTIVPWILSRGWLEAAFLPEKLPSTLRILYKKRNLSTPLGFMGFLRGPNARGFPPRNN